MEYSTRLPGGDEVLTPSPFIFVPSCYFHFFFVLIEPSLVSIGEKGARFKSYHDFSIKSLTPELSIEIQRQLGADLVVVLGESCTAFLVANNLRGRPRAYQMYGVAVLWRNLYVGMA